MQYSYEWNMVTIDVVKITRILQRMSDHKDAGNSDLYNMEADFLIGGIRDISKALDIEPKATRLSDHPNPAASLSFTLPCDMIHAVSARDKTAMETALGFIMGLWTFRTVGEAA